MNHQSVVAENRAALQATVAFGSRHLGSAKWEPEAGSEAAAEVSNAETRQGGDPWGEDPPRTAYAAANLMMTGVLDDLAGLRQLLDDKMSVIAPTVVARSAIEIASGVWWLMEPGIGVRRRVCRELVLSLTSARRAKQAAEEFRAGGFQIGQEITDASQQEARVLQRIADLGIAAPSSGYSPKIENEQAEPATAATAAMLKSGPAGVRTGRIRLSHVLGRDARRDLRADELHGARSHVRRWHAPALAPAPGGAGQCDPAGDRGVPRGVPAHQQSDGLGQARGRPMGNKAPEGLQRLAGRPGSSVDGARFMGATVMVGAVGMSVAVGTIRA